MSEECPMVDDEEPCGPPRGGNDPAQPEPRWYPSGLFILSWSVTIILLLLLVWAMGGSVALHMVLVYGIVLGLPVAVITDNRLNVLCSSVAGAAMSLIVGLPYLDISVKEWNSPNAKLPPEIVELAWIVIIGSLSGAVLGRFLPWFWARSESDNRETNQEDAT